MSGVKISEMAPDGSVGGSEMIPVSDGGAAKRISTDQLAAYAVSKMTGATEATETAGGDYILVVQGGAAKRLDIDLVVAYVWSGSPLVVATTAAAGLMSATDKTKLDGVAEGAEVNVNADWNATSGDAQILNKPGNATQSVAGLLSASDKTKLDGVQVGAQANPGNATTSTAGLMSAEDKVKVDALSNQTTLLNTAYTGLPGWVLGLDVVTSLGSEDVLYIIQGSTAKQVYLEDLLDALGASGVQGPAAPVEGMVPVWGYEGVLGEGYTVQTAVRAEGVATDNDFVTEAAIRAALPVVVTTSVDGLMSAADKTKLETIAAGAEANVNPDWNATSGKAQILNKPAVLTAAVVTFTNLNANGSVGPGETQVAFGNHTHIGLLSQDYVVQSTIRADGVATNTALATEAAIRAALDALSVAAGATVNGSTTENHLAQWDATSQQLKDGGLSVVTEVGSTGVDTAIPTEQAVREAISSASTAAVNISTLTDIDALLASTDLLSVYDLSASAMRKTDVSRVKEYIETVGTVDEIWIPAGAMTPSETAGADTETHEYGTNDLTHDALLFAGDTADESAEFNVVMPPSWDRGTVKFKAYWAPGHADANADEYVQFSLAAGAFSNDDALDEALGSAVDVTDQVIADDDLHVTAASSALTVGGTPALGDLIHFKLTRNYDYAGAGTAMDVDARLLGVLVQYQKNRQVEAWS